MVYEDGDSEDLVWEQLHRFLHRAAAAGVSKAGSGRPAAPAECSQRQAAPAARSQQQAAAAAGAAQQAPAGKQAAASKASGAAAAAAEPVPAKKRGRPPKGGAQPAAKQAKTAAGRKAQPAGSKDKGKGALGVREAATKAAPAKQPAGNKDAIALPLPEVNTQYVYARGAPPAAAAAALACVRASNGSLLSPRRAPPLLPHQCVHTNPAAFHLHVGMQARSRGGARRPSHGL